MLTKQTVCRVRTSASIAIFILIDALGWEYIKRRDFLNDLLPYRMPLRTVLGFSSGAIPTILTGLPPARTGHWNLFYYDPHNSPFRWLKYFNFLPDRMLDSRVSRKIVKELGRRVLGMGPLFECFVSPRLMPWFNWVEKHDIYSPGGITGAKSIFDELVETHTGFRVYTYRDWKDSEILSKARKDITAGEASVFFLYLSEIDHFLHFHCNEAQRIDEILAHYADQLRSLYQLAQTVNPGVAMTIFSDHGMAPVRNHYPLVSEIDALGLRSPEDYLAVYDSTMARFWLFSAQAKDAITATLERIPCGKILGRSELAALGLNFSDNRYGDLIFLLHPGWLISNNNFSSCGWHPLGMHGYHPDDPYSDAIFLSNRDPGRPMRSIAEVHACLSEAVEC
jgi:predicted AlkP superfamily pyrophosphatase or phosphodiesterase